MSAEAQINTKTIIKGDGSLWQVSNSRDLNIRRFQDASIVVLANDLQGVCQTCKLCKGVKKVEPNGSIKLEDADRLPRGLRGRCKLPETPIFINMDHLVTNTN